jgi:Ca2+-binding RTX toxin-like protein
MRKTVLVLASLLTALLLASGVALAATIRCPTEPGTNLCVGTPDNDRLFGTTTSDLMKGRGGSDVLRAEGGEDELRGAAGPDILIGASGPDSIYGGKGPDRLLGDAGNDVLRGGAGPDRYEYRFQSGGKDTIIDVPESLDPGTSEVEIGYALTESVTIDLVSSASEPEVANESGTNIINWSGDIIDKVTNLDPENDTVTGNPARNVIRSYSGNDTISSGGGGDYIDVNDFDGGDTVDCGAGEDTVRFNVGDSINDNCETKVEFP